MTKRKKILMKTFFLLTSTTMLLSGCTAVKGYTDLMEEVAGSHTSESTQNPGTEIYPADPEIAVTDFSVRLFQAGLEDGKNTLISPLSVLCALSMTANGARGETLSQMEAILGFPVEELNTYIHDYMALLPEEETYKLQLANSIWFKDVESFSVNPDFLQINADYYGAGIYKSPFDETTLHDINGWVENETDGMIRNILDKIPQEAVMYLINALSFDAEWQNIYTENRVRDGKFTLEDGTARDVEMMYSDEYAYLEDDRATGFIKYYDDRVYAFAALLPEEGVSVSEYVASLSGEELRNLLLNSETTEVKAAIPKFESEYSVEMSGILKKMGMTDAFDVTLADFSGLGSVAEGNLLINRVLHKTFITVDEKGTKAGASTVVEMTNESAALLPEEPKRVILDRPFVYMLIDCETMMPFFIGTMMDVEQH